MTDDKNNNNELEQAITETERAVKAFVAARDRLVAMLWDAPTGVTFDALARLAAARREMWESCRQEGGSDAN
jgi:hypothetical protein